MTQTSHHPSATTVDPETPVPGPLASGGLSRRSVVAGVGGVAAVGLLTACGGGGSTATAPAPATVAPAPADPPAASVGASSAADALATTSSIPVGGGTVFADKDVVDTQPTAGDYKAVSATCTHQGCKVKSVADGVIVCPCHGSKFAIADGSVTAGPAKTPLPEKSVSVEGDSIVLA
jgi:Rieske Fe-S protein